MDELAISLQHISKCFKRYDRPIHRLQELLFPHCHKGQEFWALNDVSLEVKKGEVLGIVGRNGSGKSTLLQILVGTSIATKGERHVNGRISALLELGSGFNPEFTGRQNVYFNGQLLGLKQAEIEAKFDEIAAFADIGDFIDQPVKTYSSGMFVRLAFAVATSVEPDILVVDEALSVGDEAFQRKCFARFEAVQARGGTILFVSHAATTVVQLCSRAILMDRGEILLSHDPKIVIDQYHKLIYAPSDRAEALRQEIRDCQHLSRSEYFKKNVSVIGKKSKKGDRFASDKQGLEFYDPELVPKNTISYVPRGAKIIKPRITTLDGRQVNHLVGRNEYVYTYSANFFKSASQIRFGMLVKTVSGLELGGASYPANSQHLDEAEAGMVVTVEFRFKCVLNPGVYFLNAGISGVVDGTFTYLDRAIDVAMFRVQPQRDRYGSSIVDFLIEPQIEVCEYNEQVKLESL